MTRADDLAAAFEQARPRLIRIAYAVLGSHSEAQDVVSETWLRMSAADQRDPIQDVGAWTAVAVARSAMDALRSARHRREVYVGPWLPEPMVGPMAGAGPLSQAPPVDAADRVTLDDTVSFALLVVLEALTPAERTSWVLHDLFGLPFDDVASAVGRSPAAVRQLAARARAHLAAHAPRVEVAPDQHREAVTAFLAATAGGDLAALVRTLDPGIVLTSDGGGQVSAALRPVHGPDRVGRFVLGLMRKAGPDDTVELVSVNGDPGLGLLHAGELSGVVSFTVAGQQITRIDIVQAPAKLPDPGGWAGEGH